MMVLLLWVYYSCQILLFGAEFTRVLGGAAWREGQAGGVCGEGSARGESEIGAGASIEKLADGIRGGVQPRISSRPPRGVSRSFDEARGEGSATFRRSRSVEPG